MQAHSLLYCRRCNATTPHTMQAKYDHWGALSKSVERCAVCLTEGGDHEIPADAPGEPCPLSALEVARTLFIRHLIRRGVFTDDMDQPGVWT